MSDLIPFEFDGKKVSVVTGEDGSPWFIAMEVAGILGYSDTEAMTRRLDDDEKQNLRIVGFGPRGVTIISEAGLYASILTSQKAEAKPFKRWVTHEVLPSIRNKGSYAVKVPTAALSHIDSAVQALKLAPLAVRAARAFGLDKNVAAISANQYVCSVTGHNLLKEFGSTHLPAENQDTQWFTPTELSSEAKVSARKLNEALAAAGLQERRGKVWELKPPGHAYARLFDTGKKHNSGVLVQQIKWSPSVLAELRHSGSLL